jgi:hypothetical protein
VLSILSLITFLAIQGEPSTSKCDCAHFPWNPDPPCMETCGTQIISNITFEELTKFAEIDHDGAVKIMADSITGGTPSFTKSISRLSETQKTQFFRSLSHLGEFQLSYLLLNRAGKENFLAKVKDAQYVEQEKRENIQDVGLTARVITGLNSAEIAMDTITIDSKGGSVTLSGTMANSEARATAEYVVRSTDGVKDVTNSIAISPPLK